MTKLCKCEHASQCRSELVQKVAGETFRLCQTDPRYRDVLLQNATKAEAGSMALVSRGRGCRGCNGAKQQKSQRSRLASLASAAIDFFKDGMRVATEEQQQKRMDICRECPIFSKGWCDSKRGGCGCNLPLKIKARAAYCPQGKWFAYGDTYRPLVDPNRSLIFHLYPKKGAEWNWHWHIEQIRQHQNLFNDRIVIGVGIDDRTAKMDEVQEKFNGIRVTDWVQSSNTTELAETHTHVEMLQRVKTDDPNAIVFRYHTKGVTKTPDSIEQKWARLLWEANSDVSSVEDALASHLVCGAMRSMSPLVTKKKGDFFFAGSAYWFRAAEAFERDWAYTENNRWWVEYFPCHVFSRDESACLLYDLTESSVIRANHFEKHIQPEWDQWAAARQSQST